MSVHRFGTKRPVGWPPEDDALTPEQIQQIKYDTWSTPTLADFHAAPRANRVLGVGDSWFDYPLGLDLLDQLRRNHGYHIFKLARADVTLQHLVYGAEVEENFSRTRRPIADVLDAVREFEPSILLVSGGWNDLVGPELEALLNHKRSRLPVLREPHVDYLFGTVLKGAYRELIAVVGTARADVQIIAHGYAEPLPDGRAARAPVGRGAGPWLKPALRRKDIIDADEAADVMRRLVARFNRMLAELALEHRGFHYVDVRADVGPDDWADELYPKNSAFRRAAERLHERVQRVRASRP